MHEKISRKTFMQRHQPLISILRGKILNFDFSKKKNTQVIYGTFGGFLLLLVRSLYFSAWEVTKIRGPYAHCRRLDMPRLCLIWFKSHMVYDDMVYVNISMIKKLYCVYHVMMGGVNSSLFVYGPNIVSTT